jgi:hypothetical protein
MTTEAAAVLYLAQHNFENQWRGIAKYNPHDKPLEELPRIYGIVNGGSTGWLDCVAIAADGHTLGGHICSEEGYLPYDLGVLEGARPDRHEHYQKHYPDGYVMEHVPRASIATHEGLQQAIALNKLIPRQ